MRVILAVPVVAIDREKEKTSHLHAGAGKENGKREKPFRTQKPEPVAAKPRTMEYSAGHEDTAAVSLGRVMAQEAKQGSGPHVRTNDSGDGMFNQPPTARQRRPHRGRP